MESEPSHTIEVTVEAQTWLSAVTDPVDIVKRSVATVLDHHASVLPVPVEVSVLLADDQRIQALNRAWRSKDQPTNVLAFPAREPGEPWPGWTEPVPLGDVAVALETALREAAAEGKAPTAHLAHLVVHGALHLLGHDHQSDEEAERMEALEAAILARLGVPDPYRVSAGA